MAEPLRVGLVGGGPWGRSVHAPAVACHPEFELTGVWTRRPAAAVEIAGANGATAFDDFDALVDAVDVVAFAVPPTVQSELAVAAARAGRHLILEKPIAASLDDARRLADAIGTAGVASVVVLTFRFAAETKEWLADVAGGGSWSGATGRWLSGALLDGKYAGSPWRQHEGAILDIGPHIFDLLDAALGSIVEVGAARYTEPDLWQVISVHDSGATSTATFSMRLPIDPSVLEFDVYGSAGRVVLTSRRTPADQCFATLLDELAAMIRAGVTTHGCDVRRGLHLQWVIDEVRKREADR
jgi:predicted dehydrogenase